MKMVQTNTTVSCPQCQKPVNWHRSPYRPFCSERCQVLDRAAWASEDYIISQSPGTSTPSSESQD